MPRGCGLWRSSGRRLGGQKTQWFQLSGGRHPEADTPQQPLEAKAVETLRDVIDKDSLIRLGFE